MTKKQIPNPVTAADITENRIRINGPQMKALLAEVREAKRTGQPLPPIAPLLWQQGNSQRCADVMMSLVSTPKNSGSEPGNS